MFYRGLRYRTSCHHRHWRTPLVLHHKRANTLSVARSAALVPPLGSALAAVEAEIDGIIKASRAAAKRKRV